MCSLAFSGDEYPYVIPLNYGFVWNEDQETPVLEFHHYLCAVRKFGTLQELADLIETAAQQSIAYFAAKEEA